MEPVRTLAAYLLAAAMAVSAAPVAIADPESGEGEPISTATQTVEPAAAATVVPEATLLPGSMTQSLRRGMEGEEVQRLQERLRALGYLEDEADGKFGINTLRAVKKFQRKHNLKDDGVAGKDTLTWMFSQAAISVPTSTPGPTPKPTATPTASPTPTPTPSPTPLPTPEPELTRLTPDREATVQMRGGKIEVVPARDAEGNWYLPAEELARQAGWAVEKTDAGMAFTVPGDPPRETAISYSLEGNMPVMVLVDGKLYVPSQEAQPIVDGGALFLPALFLQEAFGLNVQMGAQTES